MIDSAEPSGDTRAQFRKRTRWFLMASLFELSLLGVAALVSLVFHHSLASDIHWSMRDAGLGAAATAPPFIFFLWLFRSSSGLSRRLRQALERSARPLFQDWTIGQFAVLSIIAGISEEALFRSALLAPLVRWGGTVPALAVTSIAFGCVHFITPDYAIVTACMGAYLGLCWLWTGNLLTPIVVHALYDFLALVYFIKIAHCESERAADRRH